MTRPNLLILIFAVMTFLPSVASAAPLHEASRKGDTAEVKRLIAAGADVGARDDDGDAPLHKASRNGHAEVVEVLLAAGALVTATGHEGQTPLDVASGEGHGEVVKILINAEGGWI